MRRIYIVDDNERDAAVLKGYIDKFSKTENVECAVTEFRDGLQFLEEYDGHCDVIFADIGMPYMDGLSVIKKLRLIDPNVAVIFVTSLAQYAIDGYEVAALDYIVKPVGYAAFKLKLQRAFKHCDALEGKSVFINDGFMMKKVLVSDIIYVEKEHNYAVYHTTNGVFRERTTLSEVENKIDDECMCRCNSGCLVNYRHVSGYTNSIVDVGETTLTISRGRHKPFLDGLVIHFGERR